MAKDVVNGSDATSYSSKRVETVIIPPADDSTAEAAVPGSSGAVSAMADADAEDAAARRMRPSPSFSEAEAAAAAPPEWLWPVSGSVERGHDLSLSAMT